MSLYLRPYRGPLRRRKGITPLDTSIPVAGPTARSIAQAKHERLFGVVLELDLDYCSLTFGVSPCTAGRVESGTAQAGGSTTITLRAGASAVDDAYKNMTVNITGGTGSGQERKITGYVGSTKVATIDPAWGTNPNGTSTYDVIDRPNGCYNTFATTKDAPNYAKSVKTYKFCSRGMQIPAGEGLRPYILSAGFTPTEIDPKKGLAMRSQTQIRMADETASDFEPDKYASSRAAPAGGTFWSRLLARNLNYSGRFARVRKGYLTSPFDWETFQTELYVIDAIRGPDGEGNVTVVLSDPIKLLDTAKIPKATDGKLQAQLKGAEFTGLIVSATSTTAVLPSSVKPTESPFVGMEIFVSGGTGSGQRRVVSAYVDATNTVTVPAWSVIPDSTSTFELAKLSLSVDAGKGAQYTDPATSGKPEFIRIGDEVIRYTTKSVDTLSWPDASYRAQFGTTRSDHKGQTGSDNKGDGVQLCRAYVGQSVSAVVESLLNEGGVADTYIDLAQLASEDAQWLGTNALITACISSPESVSSLLNDFLKDMNAFAWWHPVQQQFKFKVNMPELISSPVALTDDNFIHDSVVVEKADADRITQAAQYYHLISATANRSENKNYLRAEIFIDTSAESANEYNDSRPDVRQSRWLNSQNNLIASRHAARRVANYRNAPAKVKFKLDPRDEVALADFKDIASRRLTDSAGLPATVRLRVVKLIDQGTHFDVETLTTIFGKRYAFICSNGFPDYPAASNNQRQRAFIAQNTGKMSDGSDAYRII